MNSKLIYTLAALLLLAAAVFWFNRPAPAVPMQAANDAESREVTEFTAKAFQAWQEGADDRSRRQYFAGLDRDLTQQLETALATIEQPDFSRARVSFAQGDPNTYCVDVPAEGRKVRFVVDRARGRLGLAGCGGVQ